MTDNEKALEAFNRINDTVEWTDKYFEYDEDVELIRKALKAQSEVDSWIKLMEAELKDMNGYPSVAVDWLETQLQKLKGGEK